MSTGLMRSEVRPWIVGSGFSVMGRRRKGGERSRLLLAVVVVGWFVVGCGAGATAEVLASGHGDGDLGDVGGGECWGGALDGEPEACFVLEQAEADGALQVEAVYEAPSGPLYVVLAQSEAIDEALLRVLSEKRVEFGGTPEGIKAYGLDSECHGFVDMASCVNDFFGTGPTYFHVRHGASLFSRATSTHDDVIMVAGGMGARKQVPGWGSWVQLWPKPEFGASEASADGAVVRFDVSDVDMVSGLSDDDCGSHEYVVDEGTCNIVKNFADWGYVNMHGPVGWIPGERNVIYVQMTPPMPDETKLLEFELSVLGQSDMEVYESGELDFEYIEVKYGLDQLWRWAVILDRFKYSKANTVGLTAAALWTNDVSLNQPQDIREAIAIWVLDPQTARAALPDLLPALGIPVDAVGAVYHDDTDLRRYLDRWPSAHEGTGLESRTVAAGGVTVPVPETLEDSSPSGGSSGAASEDGVASGSSEGSASPGPADPMEEGEDSGVAAAHGEAQATASEDALTGVAQAAGQDDSGGLSAPVGVAVVAGALVVAGLVIFGVRRVRAGGGMAQS